MVKGRIRIAAKFRQNFATFIFFAFLEIPKEKFLAAQLKSAVILFNLYTFFGSKILKLSG